MCPVPPWCCLVSRSGRTVACTPPFCLPLCRCRLLSLCVSFILCPAVQSRLLGGVGGLGGGGVFFLTE